MTGMTSGHAHGQAARDLWLERWLPTITDRVERLGCRQVLEIGCGSGDDTAVLVDAALEVTAFDLSAAAVEACRLRVPQARVTVLDVREHWPTEGTPIAVVVASLSLHYFPWRETVALFRRVREQLMPGGLLLCRLNSTDDVNFGAAGHPKVNSASERAYFLVDGSPKRFFSERDLDDLLQDSGPGWRELARSHEVTMKYGPAKAVWEVVLETGHAD